MPARTPEEWPGLFERHLNAGDLDAVASLYDPDATFVSKSGETLSGRLPPRSCGGSRRRRHGTGTGSAARYNLPAPSAFVVIGDRVVAASAAGRRKIDDPTPVRRTDRFKIGSVSKPVTATLVGALVEAGVGWAGPRQRDDRAGQARWPVAARPGGREGRAAGAPGRAGEVPAAGRRCAAP